MTAVDLRAIQARVDLATRMLPDDLQTSVFGLVEEAYRAGREDAARDGQDRDDEIGRLRSALSDAANAQCGCLGGTLIEYDQGISLGRSLQREAQNVEAETHVYLSTACLHDLCDQCGCKQRERGDNSPAHCKYCPAPCVHGCHQEQR